MKARRQRPTSAVHERVARERRAAEDEDLTAREDAVALRELEVERLEARLEERESLLARTRDANEQLVLTTLRAQELFDAVSQSRRELEKSDAALREANRRKDEFLAMLGHELRNPLAPIVTALEVMRLRGDEAGSRERGVIDRQVRHMVALVDDLLDVARITSGKLALHPDVVEVSAIVTSALETAWPLLGDGKRVLSTTVDPDLAVRGDRVRLAQVIGNLLTNAAKFTEPGGRIGITATRDGPWARIAIRDDGSGIAPELLPAIFDPFVQADRTLERSSGGLGLGLSIVRSLVELHRGKVTAQSAGLGHGTEVVVCLPALEPHGTAGDGRPSSEIRGRPRQAPLRVLVIDDNHDAADMLAEALRARGHEVVIAHDGPEGLEQARVFRPDTVVLDIGLPTLDGREVARALRAREAEEADPARPRQRLIAVSGYGQPRDLELSAAAGIDVHLVKPVDLETLESALTSPA